MYLMASHYARGLFAKAIAQSAYMISTPELKESKFGVAWTDAPALYRRAAALPHVDEFVEGHSVDALAALAEVLADA
jgi:uncharacterized protein with von Willebrand factor type A (vWA) domain